MVLIECVPVSFSFFCSWYLSFSPGLSFCLDWNLHWAIPFSLLPATFTHLSLLIRSKPHEKKNLPIFAFLFSFSTCLLAFLRVIVKCKWPMPVLTLSCRIWPAERQIYTLPSIPSSPSSCASRKESSLTPIHKHYAWIKKNSDCAQTFSVQYIDYLHWKTQPTTVSDVQS